MRLLLRAVGVLMRGAYRVLSRFVDPVRLDDVVVLHWCHHYIRYGLDRPPFIGMDNAPNQPTTGAATDVEATSFTANASYSGSPNTPNITERGFVWFAGTAGDPTMDDDAVFETGSWTGTGSFSWSLPFTNMTAETSYRVRAYVVNSVGTALASNTVTVTTAELPALAPTLLTPEDGTSASGEEFTWQFNTLSGDTQEAFAFRRRGGEVVDYWVSPVSGTPTLAGNGQGVAFTADGAFLAVAHFDSPFLTVVDTSDWSVVSGTPTLAGIGRGVAFTADGTRLAVAHSESPFLTIIDTSDWSVVSGTPTLASTGWGVAFSPDGAFLAAAHFDSPNLTIIDTSNWSVVSGTPTLVSTGYGVAFTADGTRLAAAHFGSPNLTVVDTSDWSVVSGTPTLAGNGYGVAFTADGAFLAVAHNNIPRLTVIDTSNWSVVEGTPTLPWDGYGAAFSPDGAYLAVAHWGSPQLTVIDTTDWSVVSGTPVLPDTGWGAAFSPNGAFLAVAHVGNPFLTVIDELPSLWWNGTDWQSTEVFITSTNQTLTLPTSAWT